MNWYKLNLHNRYCEGSEELYLLAHSAADAVICAEKQEYSSGRVVSIVCVDQPPEDNIQYQLWKSRQK